MLTLINDRNLVPVIDQNWKGAQIVLIRELLIRDLHEADAQLVGFVVDVLQFLKGLETLFAVWLVCPIWNKKQCYRGIAFRIRTERSSRVISSQTWVNFPFLSFTMFWNYYISHL